MTVLEDDLEYMAVNVDRVETAPGTEQAKADDITFLDPDRLGFREGLAVDGEVVEELDILSTTCRQTTK